MTLITFACNVNKGDGNELERRRESFVSAATNVPFLSFYHFSWLVNGIGLFFSFSKKIDRQRRERG